MVGGPKQKGIVMNASKSFKRGLKDEFVEALNREYEKDGGWWKKIVDDPELFIGIREDYLNIYFHGSSLLKLEHTGGHLVGETHYKYLLKSPCRDELDNKYVNFKKGYFDPLNGMESYRDIGEDIDAIKKKAAASLRGTEKKGVHKIILRNENIIDTEIAFPGSGKRVDFAALREEKNKLKLVFYEAKVFSSSEIRAGVGKPQVIDQLEKYEKILSERAEGIRKSYSRVATTFLDLAGCGRRSALFQQAKEGSFEVCPEVRLVIFNFNGAQREAANASGGLFARLKDILGKNRVLTKGDPRKFVVGISK